MDLSVIFDSVLDFAKLAILLSLVSFILYKIFSPLREKLAEKYSLSWIRSCIVFNVIFIFVVLFLFYLYYFFIGFSMAPLRDPELEFTFIDNIVLIGIASVRMLMAAVILGLFMLFFELVASFFMENKDEHQRSKKKGSNWIKQFTGIIVASALFVFLFLFVFEWAALGLFIFIFYGSVSPLPLVFLL